MHTYFGGGMETWVSTTETGEVRRWRNRFSGERVLVKTNHQYDIYLYVIASNNHQYDIYLYVIASNNHQYDIYLYVIARDNHQYDIYLYVIASDNHQYDIYLYVIAEIVGMAAKMRMYYDSTGVHVLHSSNGSAGVTDSYLNLDDTPILLHDESESGEDSSHTVAKLVYREDKVFRFHTACCRNWKLK
ncbi:hypothetical protein Btru_077057 [Bulinus truncatus]|nr:hypothetical protein Btru_077057 [Bulinus truncatus]